MEVSSMLSEKGKKLLLLNNYKFAKAYTAKCGKINWRCVNKKCSAKVYTANNEVTILEANLEHSHEKDPTLNRQIISNTVKNQALDDLSERPSKLILKEIQNNDIGTSMVCQDLECIRKNIYNNRRKILPKLPKSRTEVFDAIIDLQPKTNKEEAFLSVLDQQHGIIIFSCYTNLHFLCSANTIFMDGTFEYCTKFFQQLFTIHALQNGYYVPVVFCLSSNKNTISYSKIFDLLCDKCNSLDLVFQPNTIIVDFEKAIHKACLFRWPNVKIVGCRFHLCQAWYRKIQNLGLTSEFKDNDSEIGRFFKLFFGIHFLEPEIVGDFFCNELVSIMPNDERVVKFCDYILENYIQEECDFPPDMWACTTDSMCRTTNACESFHSHFNSNFYVAHPNIFNFLNILIEIQCTTYIKINSAKHSVRKLKSITRKKQSFIQTHIENYNNNVISVVEFVRIISCKYLPS